MDKENLAKNKILNIIDDISYEDMKSIIKNNPSLRGIFLGYWAEHKFQKSIEKNKKISNIKKHNDHDRENNKADREFLCNGKKITVQLKSIQTNSIKWDKNSKKYLANVQNDASCKRKINLPNGEEICTTNYKIGDYDILAVPLYPFCRKGMFAYKLNKNCRRSTYKKYTKDQQKQLLSTTEKITYPLSKDWTTDIDKIIKEV